MEISVWFLVITSECTLTVVCILSTREGGVSDIRTGLLVKVIGEEF